MSAVKQLVIIISLFILFLSTGCAKKQTPEEEMYTILENVAAKEKTFEEQQKPLTKLEKHEKTLYDQIISLGMKEYDQITKQSDEAITSANKRSELFKKETKSMKDSEQAFKKVKSVKKRIDEPKLRKSADQLYDTMTIRYQAHDSLTNFYMAALKNDIQLYKMFQNKDISAIQLEEQVKKVNLSYEQVYAANDKFNNLTKDYNTQKLSFYKQAGLSNDE
ncbi:YkyA family protein [Neobacillus dielmonensis]|uniref:YkyA family protein n=1 Tax=Neobacillus dielmonensis TaxID=1347369 RepID=UPI0005AB6298|nr:YkyA family protein [Neobacillus dielmonensis]